MEQIWKNLEDPSWWFTGVFFVVLGLILTKVVFSLIPYLWGKLSKHIPKQTKKFQRWNEKRILLDIKNTRQKDMKINWLIGRYWALFVFWFIWAGLFLVYFALSEDMSITNFSSGYKSFIVWPFYLLLLIITSHKKTLFRLMDENHRWKRIISRSSRAEKNLPPLA